MKSASAPLNIREFSRTNEPRAHFLYFLFFDYTSPIGPRSTLGGGSSEAIGFSLEKIKEAVSKKNFSLNEATKKLRADLQKRKIEIEEIESQLEKAEKLPRGESSSPDSILQILSRMSLLEKHLGEDQLKWIHEQNLQFGPEKLEELRGEWIEATEGLQKAMDKKLSISDWKTKSICIRWFGLACAFMGGNFDGPYELKKVIESEPNVFELIKNSGFVFP